LKKQIQPLPGDRGSLLQELDQRSLCPTAVIALTIGQEATMSALLGFDVTDVGIGQQPVAGFRKNVDEWIILRVQYQGADCNPLNETCRRRPQVVVVSALKTAIIGGDLIIETAQRSGAA